MSRNIDTVRRREGELVRLNMAETWVMRDGLICELRSWVIELKESDFR